MTSFPRSEHSRRDDVQSTEKTPNPRQVTRYMGFNRDEVVDGLRDIVQRLRNAGQPATIQLVGGAAIALTVNGDRPPTKDIDANVTPPAAVRDIARTVGIERGWPDGWLDENAAIVLPNQFGVGARWVTLYEEDRVSIQAGGPAMLLAMKLMSVAKRPRRDYDDVAILLAANGISRVDEAEEVLETYFPGDGLTEKTYALVQALLNQGLPDIQTPVAPDFS